MIDIVPRASVGQADWDAIAGTSPDGWVWALWDWQDMILQVPRWRLEDDSFALRESGRLLAVVPLQWSTEGRRLSGSGWGLTSPALRAGLAPGERARCFEAIVAHARAVSADRGASRIEFALSPVCPTSVDNLRGVNPFLPFGFADESGHARVLDLRPSVENLLAGCSRDARQQLKRAAAEGVTARRVDWREFADEYYHLHCDTYERTGERPHPREYFDGIADRIAPGGHAVLFAAFDRDGRAISFHNSARLRAGAMYFSGCSDPSALAKGANYLAFWEAITSAKADGAEWYELGDVFFGSADDKRRGLTTFKSKFGGDIHRHFRAAISLPPNEDVRAPLPEVSPPPEAHLLREGLRTARRLAVALVGARAGNAVARRAYRMLSATKGAFSSRPPAAPDPEPVHPLPEIPFMRPFWGSEEIRALDAPADPSRREAIEREVMRKLRSLEGFGDDTAVVLGASGRGMLNHALRVLSNHAPERRRVVVQSYCCKGLLDGIVNAGLEPRLVECDANLMLEPRAAIEAMGPDVLAIVIIHLCGGRFEDTRVLDEARRRGIYVVEDKCHALASGWSLGGDVVFYSFGPGKVAMATAGGALVSRIFQEEFAAVSAALVDEDDAKARGRFDRCRENYFSGRFSTGGYTPEVWVDDKDGRLSRLDGELLSLQLDKAREIVRRRRANADVVVGALRAHPGVFRVQRGGDHAYTKLTVCLAGRDAMGRFLTFMNAGGVEAEWMYTPLHLREGGAAFVHGALPFSESLDHSVINLPVRPNLAVEEVRRIVMLVHEFAAAEAGRG